MKLKSNFNPNYALDVLLQAKIVRLSAHDEVPAKYDPSELLLFRHSCPHAGSIIYKIIALPQSQKFTTHRPAQICTAYLPWAFGFHYEYLMHNLGLNQKNISETTHEPVNDKYSRVYREK